MFMAFSVHGCDAHEQDAAKHLTLTSKHGLALTACLRDGRPAPAFRFGDACSAATKGHTGVGFSSRAAQTVRSELP